MASAKMAAACKAAPTTLAVTASELPQKRRQVSPEAVAKFAERQTGCNP